MNIYRTVTQHLHIVLKTFFCINIVVRCYKNNKYKGLFHTYAYIKNKVFTLLLSHRLLEAYNPSKKALSITIYIYMSLKRKEEKKNDNFVY